MKLQQLMYVLEIVSRGNHLSAAAQAMHTSQPGVSRQIQLLEKELGFPIFQRTQNRIIALTEPGERVVAIASRIAEDVQSITSLKDDLSSTDNGPLTIATTHTQANYVLSNVVAAFVRDHPQVEMMLKQGDPEGICDLVRSREADFAIGTDSNQHDAGLVVLPCLELTRTVVVPVGHPLIDVEPLTLEAVAEYPLITYDPRFSGRRKALGAFAAAGLTPRVVLSAIDADVCKTYVRMGLGVSVLTTVAVSADRDSDLRALRADHLFESSMTYVKINPRTYLRPYALEFIRRLAPHLTGEVVLGALREALKAGTRP